MEELWEKEMKMMKGAWCCCFVPGKERTFVKKLQLWLKFECCYLPIYRPMGGKRALFVPGYVFVRMNILEKLRGIDDAQFLPYYHLLMIDRKIVARFTHKELASIEEEAERANVGGLSRIDEPIRVGDRVFVKESFKNGFFSKWAFLVLSCTRRNALIASGNRSLKIPLCELVKQEHKFCPVTDDIFRHGHEGQTS